MSQLLYLIVGFVAGILLAAWYLFGNRLKWNTPAHQNLNEEFTSLDPFWTKICIGDANVNLLEEEGARGGKFARLVVNSAIEKQLALAQIDDYLYRPFADYAWRPPLYVEMRVRFSRDPGPGTAGMWLWNNGMGLGAELADFRPPRWLGFCRLSPAATLAFTNVQARFRATVLNGSWPGLLSMFGVPLLPRMRAVEQPLDGLNDWTIWHTYGIEWRVDSVRLLIDGETILECAERIKGPLSLIFWYDNNQPQVGPGRFALKNEAMTEPAWLDIDYITVKPLKGYL
jgi:hypothetical protein